MAEENNKSKVQAIVEWLKMVDKPLSKKDKDKKKDTGPGDEQD